MAVLYIIPIITFVIVATGTFICYQAKSSSDNVMYKYGFWAFGISSASWLISIIQAYVLPTHLQRQAVSLGINLVIQILIFIGFIVLVVGFYKSFSNNKAR